MVVAAFVAIDFKIYVALGLGLTRQLVPVLGSPTTKVTTIVQYNSSVSGPRYAVVVVAAATSAVVVVSIVQL